MQALRFGNTPNLEYAEHKIQRSKLYSLFVSYHAEEIPIRQRRLRRRAAEVFQIGEHAEFLHRLPCQSLQGMANALHDHLGCRFLYSSLLKPIEAY